HLPRRRSIRQIANDVLHLGDRLVEDLGIASLSRKLGSTDSDSHRELPRTLLTREPRRLPQQALLRCTPGGGHRSHDPGRRRVSRGQAEPTHRLADPFARRHPQPAGWAIALERSRGARLNSVGADRIGGGGGNLTREALNCGYTASCEAVSAM